MKILHLATVASSHRYLLLPQLVRLTEDGHDVVAVSADGPDVAELERRGIRHRALAGSTRGFDPRADLRAAASFVSIVRDERPDLVHTHNPKPGLYGRVAARLQGVPRVINTVHGLYATGEDPFKRRAVVYALEAAAARFSHLELVQNVEDVALMTSTLRLSDDRVRHLGNGIDTDRFQPKTSPRVRNEVRRELGIEPDAVVVISVGRLVAEKGFPELFAASAAISAPHELLVVGPDDPEKADALSPDVLATAAGRGVRFLGHRSDIERLLAAADLFVLASHREGFPRAAMEAAAAGLPIVATDIRGCRQVVDHGETGYLVAKRNPEALAASLEDLIGHADRRSAFGGAARRKAEQSFDEQDVIIRLLDAYADLGVSPERPLLSALAE